MRVWLPRGISRRTSSRGGWSRRPGAAGLGVTAGVWRALVVRGRARLVACYGVLLSLVSLSGVGTLGLTAGVWRRAGLMPSSAVLGHTVGAWVPVGLLSGLVVIHPVRERRSWCRR